jgi:L-ascorbate metabolism protein UlaG (beta-lactamase superfamily)
MKVTSYGHACWLVEEGAARILIDPGAFSAGFEQLENLQAILITQQHPDHFVPEHLTGLLAKNPSAKLYADEESVALAAKQGITAQAVKAGDTLTVAGVNVKVLGEWHAEIHHTIPRIRNVGYLVADRFFYPGDAFTKPDQAVEILAAPAGAPWLKIGEAIDYVLAVRPSVVIPAHYAVLSEAGQAVHYGALKHYAETVGAEFRPLGPGQSTEA